MTVTQPLLITDAAPVPLQSLMPYETPVVVASIVHTHFPDAQTAIDLTYGHGRFWKNGMRLTVTGMDRDPSRAKDLVGDFTAVQLPDGSFDLAIFDPPHLADTGAASLMGRAYGSYRRLADLEAAVRAGCREARHIARIGWIVKYCDYTHASRTIFMLRWLTEEIGWPAAIVHQVRDPSQKPGRWEHQYSPRTIHSSYAIYRHDGPLHRERRR
ncbi:MAG: hypothetical protein GEU73_07990 [Chloroflexi bacterium]|nr:hypothetical protein [Chloroflexota bacterium]